MNRPYLLIGPYAVQYEPTIESGDYCVKRGDQTVARFKTLSTAQAWCTGRAREQYDNRNKPVQAECSFVNT